jgi:hypothetical protein
MTAVNFSNPTNSTAYATVLGEIREAISHVGQMTFTSDTNIPAGTVRRNGAALEYYVSGSTWTQFLGAAQIDHNSLLNYDANKHADKTGTVTVSGAWTFNAAKFAADAVVTDLNWYILGATSDGTDNGLIGICPGGAYAYTRGACLRLFGNEYTGYEGRVELFAGTDSDDGQILFGTQGAIRAIIDYNGGWQIFDVTSVQTPSTNGVNIHSDTGVLRVRNDAGDDWALVGAAFYTIESSSNQTRTTANTSWYDMSSSSVSVTDVLSGDTIMAWATVHLYNDTAPTSEIRARIAISTDYGQGVRFEDIGTLQQGISLTPIHKATGLTGTVTVKLQWCTPDTPGDTIESDQFQMFVCHIRRTK